MIPLPAYIDPEAWTGFVEMRRSMPKSKPFTHRAAVLILKELQKIKDGGGDPNEALDQSTVHGWASVYPVKKEAQRQDSVGYEEQHKRMLENSTPPPEWFKTKHIRRVS